MRLRSECLHIRSGYPAVAIRLPSPLASRPSVTIRVASPNGTDSTGRMSEPDPAVRQRAPCP